MHSDAVNDSDSVATAERAQPRFQPINQASIVGTFAMLTGSETPEPRLSRRITREKVASRSRYLAADGSSQKVSMLVPHWVTNTRSTGPSPNTWYPTAPSGPWANFVSGGTDRPWDRHDARPYFVTQARVAEARPTEGDRTWPGFRRG